MHERLSNTLYEFFLGKRVAYSVVENYVKNAWSKYGLIKSMMTTKAMCMDFWGRSSYSRAMVELRADVELKDTLVVVVPKFVDEGYTMSIIRVEYEWTPPRRSRCNVVPDVGSKVQFKPIKQVYQPVSKKNGASLSGTKKQSRTSSEVDDPVNADSDSEVDDVYNETAKFMAPTSSKVNKSSKSGSGVGNESF
ncbi:hypothetical protein Tco_0080289 [Tanacetum coccineum]